MTEPARILVFTGDGKGKTTAALGMVLRARGHGMRSLVIQFVKGDASTGELAAVGDMPDVAIVQEGLGFVPESDDPRFAAHCDAARRGLARAEEAITSGEYQLLVLDEVCYAVHRGLLGEREVIEVVQKAGPDCCIVLTGRGATEGLVELADTVTEMRCVKHGLESGRKAQEGIEI